MKPPTEMTKGNGSFIDYYLSVTHEVSSSSSDHLKKCSCREAGLKVTRPRLVEEAGPVGVTQQNKNTRETALVSV